MPEGDPEKEESDPKHEADSDNTKPDTSTEDTENREEKDSGSPGTIQLSVKSLVTGVFVLGLAVGFSGGVLTTQGTNILGNMIGQGSPSQPSGANNQQNTDKIDMSKIEMEGEPVLGDSDAPVTMVMYEDFQCPFCKQFETQTFPQIKENYVDTGKVKVVWKDFPAPSLGHNWAEPAAAAMECVYREGGNEVFWKVKDKIFSQAKTLTRGEKEFTPENIQERIKEFAAQEGASKSAIQSCIENGNPMEEVSSDKQGILNLVSQMGTPTAIIDGQKVVGAQPYSNFKQKIENALNS
ncbi:MAG: DsbA family protein [Candidatus Nanosalina sp.]